MEIKKLKKKKYNPIIVHPRKYIFKNYITRIPIYIYNKLDLDNKIYKENDIIQWCKLAGSIINGNRYINFDNKIIESEYSLNNHLLYGCWSDECQILKQQNFFNMQNVLDFFSEEGKPYGYTQCWMFAAIFDLLCQMKKIKTRVVIGKYTKIDTNKNLVYDEGDGIWNFHVWNEIWFPEEKKWYSYDCCPGVSVDEQKIFIIGPVNVSNKLNKYRKDYKYFNHLTEGEDVKIYTFKIKRKKKIYKIKKIIISKRYKT
jgi:hypothetical protein